LAIDGVAAAAEIADPAAGHGVESDAVAYLQAGGVVYGDYLAGALVAATVDLAGGVEAVHVRAADGDGVHLHDDPVGLRLGGGDGFEESLTVADY
jgi:hypothetical protein